MPTQFPTLSGQEQVDRWIGMAKANLFPYTFQLSASVTTGNFGRTGANGFAYTTFPFQSDNNSAISDLEVDLTTIPISAFGSTNDQRVIFNVQVSYSPDINMTTVTPSTSPVTPTDTGNIIYNVFDSARVDLNSAVPPPFLVVTGPPFNFNHFHRFEPYNYLLKFNQILYVHIGYLNDADVVATGTPITGSIILHMLNTGLKS